MFESVLSCFGACHRSITMHRTNKCVVLYMQHHTQLQVQQTLDCASCNMQLANSCSHTILNARVHYVNIVNFILYFLSHYCLHCIMLHVLHLHCSLTKQGCCTTANFAHATKQTCLKMQNATIPLVLLPTLLFFLF